MVNVLPVQPVTKLLDAIQDHYTPSQPGIQRMIYRLRELVYRIDGARQARGALLHPPAQRRSSAHLPPPRPPPHPPPRPPPPPQPSQRVSSHTSKATASSFTSSPFAG